VRTCPKCYRKVNEQSTCENCGYNVVSMSFEVWSDVKEKE